MNLPNKLTISRIILTLAFIYFLFFKGFSAKILALVFFLLASATDLLDGFIAKRHNQITDFGKIMDPIADKILVLSAFLSFVELKIVPAWMVAIILLREILVTAMRGFALAKGRVMPADGLGKHKMVSQFLSISVILIYILLREGGQGVFPFLSDDFEAASQSVIAALMYITIALTMISGASYVLKNRGVFTYAKDH